MAARMESHCDDFGDRQVSDTLFLTRAEVAVLTGARTRRRQIEVLVRNGIRHTINAAGWPVVTRAAVEGRTDQEQTPKWTPNKRAA